MTRERAVTDWGCPTWRSPYGYPGDQDVPSLSQWRWEFMRRNPVYRAIHERAEPMPDDLAYPEDFTVSWANEEDAEMLESMFAIFDRIVLNPMLGYQCFVDDMNMRFSGGRLISVPQRNTPEAWLKRFGTTPEREIVVLKGFIKRYCSIFDQEREGLVSIALFDHTRPLPAQIESNIEQVRKRHEKLSHQIEAFRKRIEHWPRHLRVIDARDQGATHEEIYEQFSKESAGDDEEAMDEFYRSNKAPRAQSAEWYKEATNVMDKASRLI